MSKFYVTTPIYYVNAKPHIGHAYSTILADIMARFHRQRGQEVFFLTGTDEHGAKVARAAEEEGLTPEAHVDQMAPRFERAWERLEVTNNDFIRTTEPRHLDAVRHIFQTLFDQGDIYKGEYEGWYCTYEETFYPESQIVEGGCPECGRQVQRLKEESYFFRTSKYQDRVREAVESDRLRIVPDVRRNEVLKFIEAGVDDISVSRTTFRWGIPVPFDEGHVVYVWFDALINYLSGAGYLWDQERFERLWPADIHVIGKDILKFHAVIWPSMLLALGGEEMLPRSIMTTGFWTLGGKKMSKSMGVTMDPIKITEHYGADALRYFLVREIPVGHDGEFSEEALIRRFNFDLSNDLGNLAHRTIPMLEKYCEGRIPDPPDRDPIEAGQPEAVREFIGHFERGNFPEALRVVWDRFLAVANRYVDTAAPWSLAKAGDSEGVNRVMYGLAETLRIVSTMLWPVLPHTSQAIFDQLGIDRPVSEARVPEDLEWGGLEPGSRVHRGTPLFPRIQVEEASN